MSPHREITEGTLTHVRRRPIPLGNEWALLEAASPTGLGEYSIMTSDFGINGPDVPAESVEGRVDEWYMLPTPAPVEIGQALFLTPDGQIRRARTRSEIGGSDEPKCYVAVDPQKDLEAEVICNVPRND